MAQWESGLCGCMEDTSGTLDHLCCFHCMIARSHNAAEGQIDQCSIPCCILSAWWPPLAACLLRRKVVERYDLEDTCTICVGFIAWPLSACQSHRQLSLRNEWPGGSCFHKQPMIPTNAPIQ